jgi:hypothetical protein
MIRCSVTGMTLPSGPRSPKQLRVVPVKVSWRYRFFELSSEFIHSWGPRENPIGWDIFVQGQFEVLPHFFLIGRYEHNVPTESLPNVEIGDVGILWTPFPFLNFKATYRFTDRVSEDFPEGFKTSFSVIF